MKFKSALYYLAIGFLILGMFMGEVEARRKILRGRKTINRQYFRRLGIPAWSIVLLCGLGMLVAGGGLYLVLRRAIISKADDTTSNTYHQAMQDEV
ncbi:uncharacterized protein hoka [Chelonus insularis]|uniref:uncharacterized protein hoka n=1 Tax=Chelonus insularis TaxID=460826 RepID=UPI00158B6577|nr:uncharacterized protein LOC118067751 [Chelonus insularis]